MESKQSQDNHFLHKDLDIVSQLYDGKYSNVFVVKRKNESAEMVLKVYKDLDIN